MSDDDFDEKTDSFDKTSVLTSETFKVRLAQAGKAPPCLVLLVGPANQIGRQWPIEDTDRVVGRSISAHVSVDDKSVSKSHAKLIMSGGDVSIIDLESTNKTVVNGRLLQPLAPRILVNNDQIKMGNIIFKFLERGNIETVSVAQTFDRGVVDALTQIHNKGSLMAQGPEHFKKSELLGIPLSMLVFDIDHFKLVNDNYGHAAGDHVLQELSSVIKNNLIRENDFFARAGGEEFALILLGSDLKTALAIAERVRLTIENHAFVFDGKNIPITISLGVSTKQEVHKSWLELNELADKALYMSKISGRNQVNFL